MRRTSNVGVDAILSKSVTRLLLISSVSAACLVSAGVAQAAPATADAGGGKVEEVIVTARKQSEKLQNVPVTVSALTAKTIEKLEIKSIFDLAEVTPGVYFGTSGGRNGGNKLQIRNFSTGTAGPSKASVFIDGEYIPGDYASIPLANLERVEVLKGPQSAYFGRAVEVGAINFITRDPANTFTGKFDLVEATLGEHDYSGYVSMPIIADKLSEQVTFRDYGFTGPDKWHTTDGLHLGGQSTKSITFKTLFTPTDDIKLKFGYTHVQDSDEIPPVLYSDLTSRTAMPRPDGSIGYYYNGAVHYNFSAPSWGLPTTSLSNPGIRHQTDRVALSYDVKVLGQTVSGYVSHNQDSFREQLDGNLYLSGTSPQTIPNSVGGTTAVTFASSFFNYHLNEDDNQFEIRMSSPQSQPLRYTIGYNYSKINGDAQLRLLSNALIFHSNAYGGSFLNPATDSSVFGGLFWDIGDHFTISADARYQTETVNAKSFNTSTGAVTSDVSATYRTFLPRVNLQYRVNPNLQFYAIYSEGNNPGGFQPITPAQAAANGISYNYAEEKIKNYEVGMKSTWLDGRLLVDVAAYHMDFLNEQLQQTAPISGTPTGFASIYYPGVKSKVDGFEAEADAAITSELNLRGTIGYGKAVYVSFCSTPYSALTGIQTGTNCRSVNGKQQEGTPALQTSLSADYTHHLENNMAVYLRGDWEYQSKVYNEEWDQSWIEAFSMVNARVGLESGSWTLEGFVKNATDNSDTTRSTRVTDGRAAAASVYAPNGGFSQTIAGEQNVAGTAKKPRQFGVRVAYKF